MKLHWILLSLIALFSFSILVILMTYMSRRGVPLPFILFGVFCVGAISYFIQTVQTTGFKFEISSLTLALLVIMGLLSVVGNYAQFQATSSAPNPGLAVAVVSLQSGFIALLAVIFLKDKITMLQLAGIVVGLISIAMISLGSHSDKKAEVNQSAKPNDNLRQNQKI